MSRLVTSFIVVSVSLIACSSGDIAVGKTEQQLQTKKDGSPTGNGQSCSWEATTAYDVAASASSEAPTNGPYILGDSFAALDGCNDCWCTDKGILCTIKACGGTDPKRPGPGCRADARKCPDGSVVGRAGPKCEFAPCGGQACAADAMQCPDGSWVGRSGPNCTFECPTGVVCTDDARQCPDGSWVGRSGPSCLFVCPGDVVCDAEARQCSDGSSVGRVPPNCDFAACPDPVACTLDAKACPGGGWVGRVAPKCDFAPCP